MRQSYEKEIDKVSIGSNIKAIRGKNKLSQERLAEMAGVTLGYISKLERDKADPSAKILKKIAIALNSSCDRLVFEEGERDPNDDVALLFEAVTRLPEQKKELVREFLEAIVMKSDAENWIKK